VWNRLRLAALAAYALLALAFGLDGPGMHYDEAIFLNAAVHVTTAPFDEPPFAHDPWSWFTAAGRRWPLMVLPYAAPVRSYLAMVPFAVFGANYYTARVLTALIGAFAIWALSVLVRGQLGERTAAVAAWILAVHPAYLLFTIYDQGGVAEWMLPFGLLCLALASYLRRPAVATAFWLGLAMGFGVWSRANIAWLLAAAVVAAGRGLLSVPLKHHAAAAAGGLLGAAPLLAYEFRSGWATFAYMRTTRAPEPLWESVRLRLGMLTETLLADPEMRKLWGGPPMPPWQSIFAGAVVLAALAFCFRQPKKPRFCAWIFVVLAACPLISRLSVHPHHLITVVPIAAVLVAVTAGRWRYLAAPAGLIYLGCALWWNASAARQIRATGGVGLWSDGIDELTSYLLDNHRDGRLKALDWGLNNSLFVLSGGRLRLREVFWGDWEPELAPGDVYVLHPKQLAVFPQAGDSLRAALSNTAVRTRRVPVRQRRGEGYAEVVEILPEQGFPVSRKLRY
jgi:hypothetical protein